MKITRQAKQEITAFVRGRGLHAMNAPYMIGYAFHLDEDGNLWSGMFVDSREEAERFEYAGYCPSDTLELVEL